MGSKFSKRKGEAKSKKTRKEKKKKDTRNPRDPGSTQSLNIDHSVVSISPYPNNEDQYSKPEDTQSLSGISEYQSTEQDRTFVRPRTIPALPTPAPEKDCGTYIYFKSQTIYEDGQPPASQSKPPQLTEDVSGRDCRLMSMGLKCSNCPIRSHSVFSTTTTKDVMMIIILQYYEYYQ